MWQAITGQAEGTSHATTGAPCQDREVFRIMEDSDGTEVAVGIVCDGAGSAKYSDVGADIVSSGLRTRIAQFVSEYGSTEITPAVMHEWIIELRQRVCHQAEAQALDPREFACTLVFVIASEDHTIFGQIGDGAIVFKDRNNEINVALWPDNGEYANHTFFVTQDDSHNRLQYRRHVGITDFIVFSDGLQRLALNEIDKTAHRGFFEPLINMVRASTNIQSTELGLDAFLRSERVNKRTDDDKSIVIACRII